MSYTLPCGNVGVSDNFAAHVARGSVNPGTDYVVGVGTAVHAADSGTVIIADNTISGSGGRIVSIRHANGDITDYLHLSRIDVRVGQAVTQGQQIALSGASADGSEHGVGPHLHISLHTGSGAQALTRGGSVDFQKYVGVSVSTDLVKSGQAMLAKLGYDTGGIDGIAGPKTTAATRDFQSKHGLTTDGIIGPVTIAALTAATAPAPAAGKPTLQNGSSGAAVSSLQAGLNRVFPAYSKLAVDGQFGPATAGVVKTFQSRVGITADGIVGPVTWANLAKYGVA